MSDTEYHEFRFGGSSRNVVVNVLDCDTIVSEFKFK